MMQYEVHNIIYSVLQQENAQRNQVFIFKFQCARNKKEEGIHHTYWQSHLSKAQFYPVSP